MWDGLYDNSEYFYGKHANDFLIIAGNMLVKNSNVLCLAEGEGRNAVFLAKLGLNVSAVDFSSVAKDKAMALADLEKVKIDYTVSDLAAYKIDKKFDAIISIWCHLPPAIRQQVHKNVEEGLTTNGLFILEAYNPKQLEYKTGGPPTRELLYTIDDIKNDFKNIEWILVQDSIREIAEGNAHKGTSSTIQMIGRKK